MSGFMDGIRVVELAAYGLGPMTGLILEHFGAEVIKIENPEGGDPIRGYTQPDALKVRPGGHNQMFEYTNRGKKSLTLDLRKKEGKEIAYKLIGKSDVFFTNYLPDSIKKLGFDYETVSKYNPKIVYASSSSYGKNGPEGSKGTFDALALSRSGLMLSTGEADTPPAEIRGFIADATGGVFLVLGIISGLFARERLGIGQEINTSLLGSLIWIQLGKIAPYLMGGLRVEREARTKMANPLTNNYLCKDGLWLRIQNGAGRAWHLWPEYCRVLGLESLEKDPKFEDYIKRQENCEELIKIFDNIFSNKTRKEWLEYFQAQKPGFSYECVQTIHDLPNDPQVVANDFIVDDDHPDLGRIKMVQFPLQCSKTVVEPVRKPAPELGDSTEELLSELGYDRQKIEELKKQKIV